MIEFQDVYATPGATDILWDLMLERRHENETNISFEMPSRENHEAFIKRSPFAMWFIVKEQDDVIGTVSLTWRNEVGIVLFKEWRRRGYGRRILEKLLDIAMPLPAIPGERVGHFLANINPANEGSIKLFQSLGFELAQHTYALKEEK